MKCKNKNKRIFLLEIGQFFNYHMKQVFLILGLLLISISNLHSQNERGYKIGFFGAYNQHPIIVETIINKDDSKSVIGSGYIFTIKNSSLKMDSKYSCLLGLRAITYIPANTTYYLNLNLSAKEELYSWKESPLLIKLTSGEILELKSLNDVEDKFGQYISTYTAANDYEINVLYKIKQEQIELLKNGISKIRFKINSDIIDIEIKKYKKDEVGKFLYEEYLLINRTIDQNNSIDMYEGF